MYRKQGSFKGAPSDRCPKQGGVKHRIVTLHKVQPLQAYFIFLKQKVKPFANLGTPIMKQLTGSVVNLLFENITFESSKLVHIKIGNDLSLILPFQKEMDHNSLSRWLFQ